MFLKVWRRIEAGALGYFADQLAGKKAEIVTELESALSGKTATIAQFNQIIESHVSPLARGLVGQLLEGVEDAGGSEVEANAPEFIDKVVAAARAEVTKLLA